MRNVASVIIVAFVCFFNEAQAQCCNCDCPSGWIFNNGSCYLFESVKKGWEGAKDYCESQDAHLLKVEDAEEDDFIRSTIQGLSNGVYYWIGARYNFDAEEFLWTDETPLTFLGWGPNRPRNTKGCVDYLYNTEANVIWEWNDHGDCVSTEGAFICEINCN